MRSAPLFPAAVEPQVRRTYAGRPKTGLKLPSPTKVRCFTRPKRLVPFRDGHPADVVLREAVQLPEDGVLGGLEVLVQGLPHHVATVGLGAFRIRFLPQMVAKRPACS